MKSILLSAAILTVCASTQNPSPVICFGNPPHVWALRTLQGKRVMGRSGHVATIRFNSDRSVSGTRVCNSTSSAKLQWVAAGDRQHGTFDRLGHGAGITTAVGCNAPAAYALAGRFWDLLETARRWSVQGDQMTITFGDGSNATLVSLNR